MARHPVGGQSLEHMAPVLGGMVGTLDQHQHDRTRNLVAEPFGVLVAGDAVFLAADDDIGQVIFSATPSRSKALVFSRASATISEWVRSR